MAYSAKVLLDSLSPEGVRLTTFEVTYPRIVHAEMMTHRVFSRNSASSRAIPVATMLQKVKDDPFIPIYWGKNQKGMQAEQELTEDEQGDAESQWLYARDRAVDCAQEMLEMGLHKQITNRLLEPWLFHTVIITATEWDNFWGLRCNADAQPEIRKIAEMMHSAYNTSVPMQLAHGRWHLPLTPELDDVREHGVIDWAFWCKVSAGRCARVSYLTHDGKRDLQADIELCERLLASGHMSPLEHIARPMNVDDAKRIVRKPGVVGIDVLDIDVRELFCGNFRGFVQYRKTLPNEAVFRAMTSTATGE